MVLAGLRIYCEHNSLGPEIRELANRLNIELVHFPFDPHSQTRKANISAPSAAQICDLNLPIRQLPQNIEDYSGSEHLPAILSIIGDSHRRDALHVDAALRSSCSAFVTMDSDILKNAVALEHLLGIKFFRSDSQGLHSLRQFVEGAAQSD
jgi:hypothetical protein